jgi:hypothetical protein
MCFIFVFCLSSGVEGATPIDVNNFSFEFDGDGNQIYCHAGIEPDGDWPGVRGWGISGTAWSGVDPYCLGDVEYDPCATPENICYSEQCFTDNHDGCHCWPATHGIVYSYLQATKPASVSTTFLYQNLDSNDSNAVISVGRKYTLTFDATSEIYGGVLETIINVPSLYYGDDPAADGNVLATENYTLPGWIGDFEEWNHEWEPDLTVKWVATPSHPALGETLGMRWFTPSPGGPVRAYIITDNVRMEWEWATAAYSPNPTDGEKYVDQDEDLSWTPGLWTANTSGHILYYGTDWADVNSRSRTGDTNDYSGDVNSFDPGTLELGATYYWTITEVNDSYISQPGVADPPWLGDIWSFTVEGRAANPSPEDLAIDQSIYTVLKWEPGTSSESHDIYLGTDFDEVNEANDSDPNVFMINKGPNSYDPGILNLSETYYWRIDEVRNAGANVIKGYIWSFRVADYLMVDDMESYDTSVNYIYNTWVDIGTNGSRAEIDLKLATGDANYVQDGNSMEYRFRNHLSPYYSETSRTFSSAQDWTVAGFKTLTLSLRADMDNLPSAVQPMSVFVSDGTDTGTVEYDDPNDLVRGWVGWEEWNIELQDFNDAGVNLSNVTELGIVIGDGNSAGEGYVYIDDIRLYPARCVVEKAVAGGNFTSDDCDVDMLDFAAVGRDWLLSGIGSVTASAPSDANLFGHWTLDDDVGGGGALVKANVVDSSVNGNDGLLYNGLTPQGDPKLGVTGNHSVAGKINLALEFNGLGNYVEVPALDVNSNTITMTAWVKREQAVAGHIYDGIVMSSNNYDPCGLIPGPNYTAGLQFGSDMSDWSADYELSFMWTGYSWEWDSGLFVSPDEWVFVALTVAPDVATLYLHDGITMQAARNYDTYEALTWHVPFHIGDQMQFGPTPESDRFFPGVIDDVWIYNRTLTHEEILYRALQGAGSWYQLLEPWRADADDSDDVDGYDLEIMSDNWLTEILWP